MPSPSVLNKIDHIKDMVREYKKASSAPLALRYPAASDANNPHSPTSYPDINQFMDKLIIVFVPHIQYPDFNLLCLNEDKHNNPCSGRYRPDGFVKQDDGTCYRRVYDMDRSLYFIPYKYKCSLCNSSKTSAVMLEESQSNIEHPYIPLDVQIEIGIHFARERSAVRAL